VRPRRPIRAEDAQAEGVRASVAALLVLAAPLAGAVEVGSPEGELYAFPSLLDESQAPLATSTLEQWFQGGRLHVRITHRFPDGKRAVERARFVQWRELVQEAWSWEERVGDRLLRRFEVDLVQGRATARKVEQDGDEKSWDEGVKVERGRTFAGLGIVYAVKQLRDAVVAGEDVELRGIAFLPKPISVPLRVKHVKRERIALAGRHVDADRFEIRPDLKGIEKLVELVKDPAGADVWLHHGKPPLLLRLRYPLAEVRDPTVVIETLGAPRKVRGAARRPGPAARAP
jgi:hypothetical protein